MKKLITSLAAALGVGLSMPLQAQTVGSYPAAERGTRSIVLDVSGNPQVGYWIRNSDRTDLGFDLVVDGIYSETSRRVGLAITPALKRYHSAQSALAPYTYVGIPLAYSRVVNKNTGTPDTTHDAYSVGGLFGLGLEWLPIRQVSIGGHVGFRANYSGVGGGGGSFAVRTQSSGLRVHLYF